MEPRTSSKSEVKVLQFFKCTFERESYIDIDLSYNELKRLSQFRMSSHKYNIETWGVMGRRMVTFSTELVSIAQLRIKKQLAYFSNARSLTQFLRMNNISLLHVLGMTVYRSKTEDETAETRTLSETPYGLARIFQGEKSPLIKDLAKFILRCHKARHPEEVKEEEKRA